MASVRGRPSKIDHELVQSVLLKYRDQVIFDNQKIAGKADKIWGMLASETKVSPLSLYTYVTCNRMNIRDKLASAGDGCESFSKCDGKKGKKRMRENDESLDSSHNSTLSDVTLEICFSKSEFDNLLEYKLYKRTEKTRRYVTHRRYAVLKSGEWQLLITKKLWDKYEHTCGYHFKTHKIYMASSTGTFSGRCKCGSTVTGFIKNLTEQVIPVTCVVTRGDGQCGKRYLRQPERHGIAKELRDKNKSAAIYRCQKASTMMREGGPEPPHLYKANVMKEAKKEYAAEQHEDPDPLTSLELLQTSSYKEIIHNIGLNPFYVHYWTNNQIHVYRESLKKEHLCVALDATGSIVRKLDRIDGSKSRHIFLYECVIRTNEGQFPIAQLLSESHNTVCIQYWLMVWTRTGAPPPKEVVCDGAKALLSAAIRAFTQHKTLHEYSDACMHSTPDCYVRIDVAHFMKTYADFLKPSSSRIKKFWLASIGQLVLTKDIHEAESLLECILIVARSETEGVMSNGQLTQCEINKTKLKTFLTDTTVLSLIPKETSTSDQVAQPSQPGQPAQVSDTDERNADDENVEDISSNRGGSTWYRWAASIDTRVCSTIEAEEGDRDNAHHLPKLANRLINDIKLFPLWSCVVRNQFGYGRVPASSTSVESDFNNIKTRLLNAQPLPMRIDDFIKEHIQLLTGKMLTVDANLNDNKTHFSSRPESHEEQVDEPSAPQSPLDVSVEASNTMDCQNQSKPEVSHPPIRCQVCADGNEPTGAHRCALCNKAVHIIAGCSAPIDGEAEGYGSKRICKSCEQIASYQEYENWRNLANKPIKKKTIKAKETTVSETQRTAPIDSKNAAIQTQSNDENGADESSISNGAEDADKLNDEDAENHPPNVPNSKHSSNSNKLTKTSNSKKVSRYLTKNTLDNICNLNEKVSTMPILKNGSSLTLMPIAMEGKNVSMLLTCPHDSIFQLFLCAAFDYESLSTYMDEKKNHLFFRLVKHVVSKGVGRQVYELRAALLQAHFEGKEQPNNCIVVNCQTSAEHMYHLLMQTTPSFVEVTSCSRNCTDPRTTKLGIIHGEHSWLSSNVHFQNMIEGNVVIRRKNKRPCHTDGCEGFLETNIAQTGLKGTNPPVVEIQPSGSVPVKIGESLKIMCKLPQKLRVCRVEIPGEGSIILSPGQTAEDGIEYYGAGTDSGQCGVHIAKIKESHDGVFKCSLTTNDFRTEAQASVKIVVAKPPHNPEIHLSPGSIGNNKYRSGDRLEISCIARSGRPAANVSLYLDDEPIGHEGRPIYDSSINNTLAIQNESRTVDWTDNGKILRCVAHHIALDQPKESRQELQVFFAPQPQKEIERFGYVIGRPGIVNVTVHANPKPSFVWRINGEQINEGRPDESNRLQTSTSVDLGKGAWAVELRIDSVQKSDTEKDYILEARNDEGAYEYRIVLSTSAEPAGVDLDAGSIIGIAVGVLVLILVVFLIVFARATGRWCFAGGSSTRNIGESDVADPAANVNLLRFYKPNTDNGQRSDTESAGRYSRTEVDGAGPGGRRRRPKITFSQLFKRNKDKVSGADTDTVRTVVTVDDEKLQSAESAVDSQRTNPPGEGGIVYAELDLTQQQQGVGPRRISDDKTEYAEIVYTKPADGAEAATPEK